MVGSPHHAGQCDLPPRVDLPALVANNQLTMTSLTATQLRKAATIREKIDALQAQLESILGEPVAPRAAAPKRKRKMSAAGRARISAASKARWARVRAAAKKKP